MTKLVRACLLMPHGNAEIERIFSMLADIFTKKRNFLDERSIQALLFCKSDMLARRLFCHDFSITLQLINMTLHARKTYLLRIEEGKRLKNSLKEKELMNRNLNSLRVCQEQSVHLNQIASSVEALNTKIDRSAEKIKTAEAIEADARKMRETAVREQGQDLQ